MRKKCGTDLTNWCTVPRFNAWLLKIWAKSEVPFWYHPENKWPTPHSMELSVCLIRNRVGRYFLNKVACKNISGAQHKKLWWFGKRFHNLLKFHNGSRNVFVNTNVENRGFFSNNVAKTCSYGLNTFCHHQALKC